VYTTCLFCHADLGRNEVLEAFPVGRRLAYDAEKGRLWVVCRGCERWNLTPQEERWEAIEQAERLYRGTRLHASTDNIGLARLGDATELVRVGRPLRPEFAAWRYGDQFGRRRVRAALRTAGALGVVGAALWGGPALGLYTGGSVQLVHYGYQAFAIWRQRRQVVARVPGGDDPAAPDRRLAILHVWRARLERTVHGGWRLEFPYIGAPRRETFDADGLHWRPAVASLDGDAALRAAGRILPHVNRGGAGRAAVNSAVQLLDGAGSAERAFALAAGLGDSRWRRSATWRSAEHGTIAKLAPEIRLALEMACHEEQERRAVDGELRELEEAWRRAEEIAAIADDLLLPERLTQKLDQLRGRSSARAGAASSPASDRGGATSS
jgi:hypothetical protein